MWVCPQLSGHGSTRSGGAALTIETGAKIQIGPKQMLLLTFGREKPRKEPLLVAFSLTNVIDAEFPICIGSLVEPEW